MSDTCPWEQYPLHELEEKGVVTLGRGNIISKIDIKNNPGGFPIYSSSAKGEGLFGAYGDYMFDEEMITWSVDGGGNLFYRPRHKFSVTNVSGYLRLDTSVLDYQFAHASLALQHSKLTFDYQTKAHPSVIRNLYNLPIPPLPEQKKIAEILSGIDRLTEAMKRRVKQRKLLLKSAFEDATKKEASDDFVPLSDLGRWRGGGTPSKSIPEYWGGEIPWVSPKDMKGRKISFSQDAITQEALENSTTSLIPKDSILFVVRSGILRHTFPIALATREVAINQDLKALTVSDYCNPNFLLHYLCCRSEEMLASCMKSGTTVESIDTNSLQNYLVPVISIQEQLRLSLFAESITTAIEAEESQVESLKMLKSSLGSDLLSGRKRVSI